MALTLSAVADCKQIRLGQVGLRVDCQAAPDRDDSITFGIQIDLGPGLTHRERTILLNSARSCEVSKILASDIDFNFQLTPADDYRRVPEMGNLERGDGV